MTINNNTETLSTGLVTTFCSLQTSPRKAKLIGRDYNVYNAVMMREGAYYPNVGTSDKPVGVFFSSDELERSVKSWDGRPVSIEHPLCSETCNTPDVFDSQWIGYVFNTKFSEDHKGLVCDIWIESPRGDCISAKINKGENMEVSIGAFGKLIDGLGEHSGIPYHVSMEDIRGDHLAVLPASTGACSWEDGCGVRAEKNDCVCDIKENVTAVDKPCKKWLEDGIDEKRGNIAQKPINKEFNGMDKENGHARQDTVKAETKDEIVSGCRCGDKQPGGEKKVTIDQFVESAPDNIKTVLAGALRAATAKRKKMVDVVKSVEGVTFCSQFLESVDHEPLESIYNLAVLANTKKEMKQKSNVDYGMKAVGASTSLGYMPTPTINWDD